MNVIEKLKEFGIITKNTYPKKTFINNENVVISCYPREVSEDFYFFNDFDNNLYKLPKIENLDSYTLDGNTGRYLIPLSYCESIWKDEPFQELPDAPFNIMTLRQFAAIKLKVPKSGLPWLDEMIKESKNEH